MILRVSCTIIIRPYILQSLLLLKIAIMYFGEIRWSLFFRSNMMENSPAQMPIPMTVNPTNKRTTCCQETYACSLQLEPFVVLFFGISTFLITIRRQFVYNRCQRPLLHELLPHTQHVRFLR